MRISGTSISLMTRFLIYLMMEWGKADFLKIRSRPFA